MKFFRKDFNLFSMARSPIAGLLLFSVFSSSAHAASLVVPTDTVEAPAVDLIYDGKPIDRDQATSLVKKGVDISALDPVATDSWKPEALSPEDGQRGDFPDEGATLNFTSISWNSQGLFRISADLGQGEASKAFRVNFSLDSHVALMEAALLREMGYVSPSPKYFRTLTIRFPDLDSRKKVVDEMVLTTGRAADDSRWIKSLPDDQPIMVVQDVVLESAQILNRSFYWSVINSRDIKSRRALRSLIIPFVWMDIPESVNRFSWEAGKTNQKSVWLIHDYAGEFKDTTFEDCRWLLRKIAALKREQIRQIVAIGKYPEDVSALIVEKLIARRNHMVRMFGLYDELPNPLKELPYNSSLSIGAVKEGRLTQEKYDGYALRFAHPLPESPLRLEEVGRFALMEGISFGLEQLLNRAGKYLSYDASDLAAKHAQKVQDEFVKHLITQPGVPYSQPVATWGGTIGGIGFQASRNVVTGTFYGSESKVQLVDNISVTGRVGYFLGLEGIPTVQVGVSGNLSKQLNFVHVKPVADVKEALKSNWGNLWVPGFLSGLKDVLTADEANKPTNVCFVASDPSDASTKCPSASPEGSGSGGDSEKNKKAVDTFLENLQENELFTVTATTGTMVGVSIEIPLTAFLPTGPIGLGPSIGITPSTQYMVLSRTTFLRTKDGVQIYIQTMNSFGADIAVDFNWFINIARISHAHKDGTAHTRAFLLDAVPDTDEKRRKWLVSLRALIADNNTDILASNFSPWELDHDMTSEISKGKFLFWKWYSLEEGHRVKVRPPADPDHPFDPKAVERSLFSYRKVSVNGNDYFGFVSDMVSGLDSDYKYNVDRYGNNPSDTPFGSSHWREVRTEAETTPKADYQPVTSVEEHWAGWVMSKDGVFEILKAIEDKVKPINHDNPIIRNDEFNSMGSLQMYEIRTTQLMYPKGLQKIEDFLFNAKATDAFTNILNLLGKTNTYYMSQKGDHRFIVYLPERLNPRLGLNDETQLGEAVMDFEGDNTIIFMHLAPEVRALMEMRKERPTEPEKRVEWVNGVVWELQEKLSLAQFVDLVGPENFFFQVKVSGFRTDDENGDVQYTSDSVGKADPVLGSGIFSQFADKYKLMSHELYAKYLSDGF